MLRKEWGFASLPENKITGVDNDKVLYFTSACTATYALYKQTYIWLAENSFDSSRIQWDPCKPEPLVYYVNFRIQKFTYIEFNIKSMINIIYKIIH